MENKNKIAEIIPLIRLPRTMGIFDYHISNELSRHIKIGQMVEIPFRKSIIRGIVVNIKSFTNFHINALKSIIRIKDLEPILTKDQIGLIFWMSEYYFQSPGIIAKTVLPKTFKPIKGYKITKNKNIAIRPSSRKYSNTISEILHTQHSKFLVVGESNLDFYREIITECIADGSQVILLFPEIFLTNKNILYFKNYFKENILAVIHSKISKLKHYEYFVRIINGDVKIIIGTRMAIFSPCQNLKLIIIDSEHDTSYKQWDQNPRYHSRDVAYQIIKNNNAKIILSSICPSVVTYHKAIIENWKILYSHQGDLNNRFKEKSLKTTLVDLQEEKKLKNYTPFSIFLKYSIKKYLIKRQKVFLIYAQKGFYKSIECKDCGYIPECKNCFIPLQHLILSQKIHYELYCYNCKKYYVVPPFCDKCHGVEFIFKGYGIQRILYDLKHLYPKKNIFYIQKDNDINNKHFYGKIDNANILLGYPNILLHMKADTIDHIAIISIDNILHLSDFSTNEIIWRILKYSQRIAKKTLTLQTYFAQHFIWNYLYSNNIHEFYMKELDNRKDFNYPPFSNLIKIIVQNKNLLKVKNEANNLYDLLKKINLQDQLKLDIFRPIPSYIIKVRGNYRYYIIIKNKNTLSYLFRNKLLKYIPQRYLIDIDPETIQ